MIYAHKRHPDRPCTISFVIHVHSDVSKSLITFKIIFLPPKFISPLKRWHQQFPLLPTRISESMYDLWITHWDNISWTVSISLFTKRRGHIERRTILFSYLFSICACVNVYMLCRALCECTFVSIYSMCEWFDGVAFFCRSFSFCHVLFSSDLCVVRVRKKDHQTEWRAHNTN